jgi:hypothetical protein
VQVSLSDCFAMYAAESAASFRDKLIPCIGGCGANKNNATLPALKFFRSVISEKGGASVLPCVCPAETTWQLEHHRSAMAPPRFASAAKHCIPLSGSKLNANSSVVRRMAGDLSCSAQHEPARPAEVPMGELCATENGVGEAVRGRQLRGY